MIPIFRSLARLVPPVRDVLDARDRLRQELQELRTRHFVPPGHFYSPIPSLDEVRRDEARIFSSPPRALPGIDMREEEQLRLVERCAVHYRDMPHRAEQSATDQRLRYNFDNRAYTYGDAIFLWGIIAETRPRHIIEVGSGHSSALMLDAAEHYKTGTSFTFIEPYPDLLKSLIRDDDNVTIFPSRLQDMPLDLFDILDAGDILFIDSTHVSRIDSDVNRVIFDILPRLKPGVLVHIHDMFWPFEYPAAWVYEGRAWNEAYIVRAWLQNNPTVEIVMMNSYLAAFHMQTLESSFKEYQSASGGSLWLRILPR